MLPVYISSYTYHRAFTTFFEKNTKMYMYVEFALTKHGLLSIFYLLVFHSVFHSTQQQQQQGSSGSDSEDETEESRRMIKIKAANHHKGPYDFDLLVPVQEMHSAHNVSLHQEQSVPTF